ncbi:hypothetical protein CUMW_148650 [Citrus unshiu]|uniref:Uncharacterized protein n=1 Tax=Citrus unshiu TaxID=55188 RepID=A0A2H5PLY7_CITUN|nr:hypothetical protein CUMW_148650 [Citrus unshiu]
MFAIGTPTHKALQGSSSIHSEIQKPPIASVGLNLHLWGPTTDHPLSLDILSKKSFREIHHYCDISMCRSFIFGHETRRDHKEICTTSPSPNSYLLSLVHIKAPRAFPKKRNHYRKIQPDHQAIWKMSFGTEPPSKSGF